MKQFFRLLAEFLYAPLRVWREERQLDREANILIATELCKAIKEMTATQAKAMDMVNLVMTTFSPTEGGERRVVRDEDEVAMLLDSYNISPEDLA